MMLVGGKLLRISSYFLSACLLFAFGCTQIRAVKIRQLGSDYTYLSSNSEEENVFNLLHV